MTAMKEALKKAGIVSAEERLQEIAVNAMVRLADNVHDTMEEIWNVVSKDLSLMVALFEVARWNEIRALLNRTRNAISSRESKRQLRSVRDRRAALVVNNLKAADERIRQQEKADEAAEQAKADAEHAERLAAWQRSAIGDCMVSGVPIWQVTPRTARLWAERQTKRWKIVEMLCDGLPDDGHPIEYYRKPEEVAELWRRTWKREDVP